MSNSNVLESTACPKCGYTDRFRIDLVTVVGEVTDDGLADSWSPEWSPNARMFCGACDYVGVVRDFTGGSADEALPTAADPRSAGLSAAQRLAASVMTRREASAAMEALRERFFSEGDLEGYRAGIQGLARAALDDPERADEVATEVIDTVSFDDVVSYAFEDDGGLIGDRVDDIASRLNDEDADED